MTRLEIYLNPGATVGQLNSALRSVGGGIVTMLTGLPAMTISVPPQPDVNALLGLTQILDQSPAINAAFLANVVSPKVLPPGPAGDPSNRDQIGHLLPARFPAAWNVSHRATNNCAGRRVTVFVADSFGDSYPGAADFTTEIPRFRLTGAPFDHTNSHGNYVTTTLAALFNGKNPAGANPFSDCLQLELVQLGNLAIVDSVAAIQASLPSPGNKFILNCSWGFTDTCTNGCTANQFGTVIAVPKLRAYAAALWEMATISQWDDFLVCVAAGNERNQQSEGIYSGLGIARFSSLMGIAAKEAPGFSFMQDSSFWEPSVAGFPSMTARASDAAALQSYLTTKGISARETNVLIVGSTTTNSRLAGLQESRLSDFGADCYAVGEKVFMLGPTNLDGTSFSTPQVAGLASYLWLLSDQLRALPSQSTLRAIQENTRPLPQLGIDGNVIPFIDAYGTVLSLDQAVLPTKATAPVRFALLDVNNDDKFDENDLFIHLFTNGLANPLLPGGTNDFGRSDLNGDGVTGGSGTERFDLDRVGSEQFGFTLYDLTVTQSIEGLPITYKENAVSDLDVLCYCAYSGLYTGTDQAKRRELLGDLCNKITVTIIQGCPSMNPGQSCQFLARVDGTGDQRVTWSVSNSAGTVNLTTGLLTAGCPGSLVIRATSVVATNKFAEATVVVTAPIVILTDTVTAGACSRGHASPTACGPGDVYIDDGPDEAKVDGINSVLIQFPCFCTNGSTFVFPFDVLAISQEGPNPGGCPGINPARAQAQLTARFTSGSQTRVTANVDPNWGIGSFSIHVNLQDAVGDNILLTAQSPSATFQLPTNTDLNISLDASCTGDSSGAGRAATITFEPLAAPGLFALSPSQSIAQVNQPAYLAFGWTVPDPENWHDLRDLQLRIRDGNNVIFWSRFNEADRTFSLYNQAAGRFGPAATAGSHMRLETSAAALHLAETSVVATGPTSPTVTLNLAVTFKPSAAGRTYIVEVAASDDDGNIADFTQAGILTIAR
jgi:hypothetical protein